MDCVHCGLCLVGLTYVETATRKQPATADLHRGAVTDAGAKTITARSARHVPVPGVPWPARTAVPPAATTGNIIGSYKKELAKLGTGRADVRGRCCSEDALTPDAPTPGGCAGGAGGGGGGVGMGRCVSAEARPARLGRRRWPSDWPASLRRMQEIVPSIWRPLRQMPGGAAEEGPRRARVALLIAARPTRFFLANDAGDRAGCAEERLRVWDAARQGVCGELPFPLRARPRGAGDGRRPNCAAFGKELQSVEAIITNAGGCGPLLKEYGHLMEGPRRGWPRSSPTRSAISTIPRRVAPDQPAHQSALKIRATYPTPAA